MDRVRCGSGRGLGTQAGSMEIMWIGFGVGLVGGLVHRHAVWRSCG